MNAAQANRQSRKLMAEAEVGRSRPNPGTPACGQPRVPAPAAPQVAIRRVSHEAAAARTEVATARDEAAEARDDAAEAREEAVTAREEAADMRLAALGAATEARTAEVEASVRRREARDAHGLAQFELSPQRVHSGSGPTARLRWLASSPQPHSRHTLPGYAWLREALPGLPRLCGALRSSAWLRAAFAQRKRLARCGRMQAAGRHGATSTCAPQAPPTPHPPR